MIFSGGDGSQTNPHQIASVEDLLQLSNDVKGGNTYYGKYFIVTANIDLSSGVANWQPIGDQYNSFAGTFDGNNSEYTISNMKIRRTAYCQGLFGYNKGTIKNVNLINADVKGNNYVGGSGKDYLSGYKGNDTLWGGAGNDTLYGGAGNDVIDNSGDSVTIDGGNLTLTISGGGKVVFEGVSSGDSFNINGKNYTLSGKKLK